jgi:hypothetical protein
MLDVNCKPCRALHWLGPSIDRNSEVEAYDLSHLRQTDHQPLGLVRHWVARLAKAAVCESERQRLAVLCADTDDMAISFPSLCIQPLSGLRIPWSRLRNDPFAHYTDRRKVSLRPKRHQNCR